MDFYDTRSKTIIKNRVILDKLFAERGIESLIEQSSNGSNETFLSTGLVALPGPIGGDSYEQASPEKRILRSAGASTCGDAPGSLAANRPERYRVQLLLTFPHIVSQNCPYICGFSFTILCCWFWLTRQQLTPNLSLYKSQNYQPGDISLI